MKETIVCPEKPIGLSPTVLDILINQMSADLNTFLAQGGKSSDFLRGYTETLSSSPLFKDLARDMEIKPNQVLNRHAISCMVLGFYIGWRARSTVRELTIMDVLFSEEDPIK